jgi:hypothetical protein
MHTPRGQTPKNQFGSHDRNRAIPIPVSFPRLPPDFENAIRKVPVSLTKGCENLKVTPLETPRPLRTTILPLPATLRMNWRRYSCVTPAVSIDVFRVVCIFYKQMSSPGATVLSSESLHVAAKPSYSAISMVGPAFADKVAGGH